MSRHKLLITLTMISIALLHQGANCQTDPSAGILPFSINTGGQYDSIDPATGNIMVTIPVMSKAGKLSFSFNLVQNFHIYPWAPSCPSCWAWQIPFPGPLTGNNGGMNGLPTAGLNSKLYFTTSNATCNGVNDEITVTNFVLVDPTGASHPFPSDVTYGPCGNSGGGTRPSSDSSGFTLGIAATNPPQYTLYDRSGNQLVLTAGSFNYLIVSSVVDPDGVSMSMSSQTVNGSIIDTYTDTLGLTAVTATLPVSRDLIDNGSSAPDTYTYADAQGNLQTVKVNYALYTLRTNFGCSSPSDVNFGGWYFPVSVQLADGETFGISYEATLGYSGAITGRLNQLTLPGGGSVSYTYSGGTNGVSCGGFFNQSPMITRKVNDGNGHVSTWTYSASVPDQYSNFTVTATDPLNDTTTYHFYGTLPTEVTITDANLGLLSTTVTCYNGHNASQSTCIAPQQSYAFGVGVYQTDRYSALGSALPSLVETQYDGDGIPFSSTYGNVIAVKQYGAGATYPPSGASVSTQAITYANINGTNCGIVNAFIHDRPCSVTTTGSGATLNQLLYTFNSAGHPIQTSALVSGSTYLNSSATYNGNGTIATSTDVNGATVNYYYNGPGGCNNLLVTSVGLPVNNLATSQTWNCYGGMLTSTTDANGANTQYGYLDQNGVADPLWRLRSTTDPLSNRTWITYSPAGTIPVTAESILLFNNGASAVDHLATYDGLGRTILSQTRQAPGSTSFDTTSIGYDAVGRAFTQGLPCVSTASTPCALAVITTTYDALGRKLQVQDGGGGYTTYSYTPNGSYLDVLVKHGPAPTGENLKERQLEYDALGRLTSVCELTSASGSGTCAQSLPQTGYWTTYSYDSLSRLAGVTQNSQGTSQTRVFAYDDLGRLTSERNPEWGPGTAIYTYDFDSSGKCTGQYSGDLVNRTDNAGNVSCYTYDRLHRALSTTYSGPNATTSRYFVYDAATVGGQSMANARGQLAEGYTATCSTCSKVTDEGFGYSVRGELSDFYESTPNSGGYYHVPMTYWANGLLATFGPFLNQLNYQVSPDGEGRFGALGGGNVTYYPSGQVNTIQTSRAGTTWYPITYQYDPNTLRMTQYSAALNGGTISGTLNWNQNGSLQQLTIADPFNASDAQTCQYSADDLSRLASVNCGSIWTQNFSYDPFGNLTKSGSISWNPGYNATTNHYTLGGTSYDANGNLLNDSFNTFTWDAEGKMLSTHYFSGNGATYSFVYDAFGRQVEWAYNGSYQNSNIAIGNFKLIGIGQTPGYSIYPYPGGSYESAGQGGTGVNLADWLGTSRAWYGYSGGGFISSSAHAPFGETYAGHVRPFTGQESDGSMVNTMYYFGQRNYSSGEGRWLSPDPAGTAAVDPTNPQSWNRYAYVMSNPLGAIDPTGTCDPETDASCTVQCNIGSGQPCRPCNPSMDGGDCGNSQLAQEAQGYFDSLLNQDTAKALAAYQNCIAFNYSCDANGRALSGPTTIWVYCGGTFAIINCSAPENAIAGSQSVSIYTSLGMQYGLSLLSRYQADPMSSSGKDVLQQLSQMSGSAQAFIIVGYGGSVLGGAGEAIASDLAAGPQQSVLFGRFSWDDGGFSGLLNSNDWFRIGYGWDKGLVFRIGGKLLEFMDNPHINLWRF